MSDINTYMLKIFVTNSYTEFHGKVITGWLADTTSQTEKQTDGCGLHIISLHNFLSYGKVTVGKKLRLSSGNISPKCDTAGILWWLSTFREDKLPLSLLMAGIYLRVWLGPAVIQFTKEFFFRWWLLSWTRNISLSMLSWPSQPKTCNNKLSQLNAVSTSTDAYSLYISTKIIFLILYFFYVQHWKWAHSFKKGKEYLEMSSSVRESPQECILSYLTYKHLLSRIFYDVGHHLISVSLHEIYPLLCWFRYTSVHIFVQVSRYMTEYQKTQKKERYLFYFFTAEYNLNFSYY